MTAALLAEPIMKGSWRSVSLLLCGCALLCAWGADNEALGSTTQNEGEALGVPAPVVTAAKLLKHFIHGGRHARQASDKTNNVVFIIDSSNSIREAEFRVGLQAVKTLIDKAVLQSRYAFVNFATEAELVSGFVSPEQALNIVDTIPRLAGATNTQAAFTMCLDELYGNESSGFDQEGHRNVVLLTDGLSNRERHLTLHKASQLKKNGTEIFVVAIGGFQYGILEILSMVSSPEDHVFRVNSYDSLLEVANLLPPYERPRVPMYKLP